MLGNEWFVQASARAKNSSDGAFFTSEAESARVHANVLVHVRKGCLSDEPDLPVAIRSPTGSLRSIRSTSQVELLHRRYEELKCGTQMGPEVGHSLLQQFSQENNVCASSLFMHVNLAFLLQVNQEVRWKGLPDMHTTDVALLIDIHSLATRVFGNDPAWAFLDEIKAVKSGEKFGATRYSSAFDAPITPLPIPISTALALAADAKSQSGAVKNRVGTALLSRPPDQAAALLAAQQAFQGKGGGGSKAADDKFDLDVLKPADIKSRMAAPSSDFSSFAAHSAAAAPHVPDSSDSAADGKAELELSLALKQSKELHDQVQAEIARHSTAVRDVAAVWGYSVQSVPADGHCGPKAVLDQLRLRPKISERMKLNLQSIADVRKLIGAELLGSRKAEYWDLTSELWGRLVYDTEVAAWVETGSWKSEIMNLFLLAVANTFSAVVLVVRSVPVHILLVLPTSGKALDVLSVGHLLIDSKEHFDGLAPADFAAERKLIELLANSVCLLRSLRHTLAW